MARRRRHISQHRRLAQLAHRFETKTATIGIIGLGYVGLPLAVEFARRGFRVVGIDLDQRRVANVNAARSYIPDIPAAILRQVVRTKRLKATTTFERLAHLDAVIICVPTPLRKTREPDISYILGATRHIAAHLHAGQLVVLESTTYPGTTDEVILPMLEERGLKVGRDFSLAFSPERIDPGNPTFETRNIPKVIGGMTPLCQRLAVALYGQIIQTVIPVSSPKVAEMVKLLENTFRAVNIGLVNEIALMCDKLGIDVWEVIDAAKTKPFGFMAFYPGPGIGGHCIPSDPMYLAWKARAHGFEARFIELADQVNRYMPHYVVDKVTAALNHRKKALKGSRILLLGLAYKKDVNDTRDSPAFEVAQELLDRGALVVYHDPYVPAATINGVALRRVALTTAQLTRTDCVVILTDHSHVDYRMILQRAPVIIDTRHHYRNARRFAKKIVSL